MPQRKNLKPALTDTLRQLRNDINAGATVPHGVKTVEPGEGLQLIAPTGAEDPDIFWGWETATTYRRRIEEGQAAIDAGRLELDQVRLDLDAGAQRLTENRQLIDALAPQVETARTTAAQAAQDLDALAGTVGDTRAAAAAAQATAQDALLLGFGRDVLPPRGPNDASWWAPLTWDPAAPGDTTGTTVGALAAVKGSPLIAPAPVVPGEYAWSVSTRASVADTRYYLQLRCYAEDGTNLPPNTYVVSNRVVPADSWETLSGTVTLPEGAATVRLQVYAVHPNGAQPEGAVQWFRGLSLRRLVPGALVVNGSITGKQLEGESVAAEVVRSMTAEHRKLVVTAEAVLQHTTLLGTTVAEELNVRRLLRGRDAILDGTVDIAQLNVTGEMAAEVVRMMDAETRRLVVTEDAILNRATVIESLVTPQLIADRVDARYLRAQDISTANLEVLGRFRTAPMGQPQIIIQPSQSAWNNKDLAIWWTPDGGTPGAGNAQAPGVAGGIWMNPTSDTGAGWEGRTLNLRGQSRAGVSISDGLLIQATDKATGCSILSSSGQLLNIIGQNGVRIRGNNGPSIIDCEKALDIACMDGRTLLLGKTTEVISNDNMHLQSTNSDVFIEPGNNNEVRLHAGTAGVRFTSKNGNSWSYNLTTSNGANLNIDGNGKVYRTTSSRRYKKYISDAPINPADIEKVRLRKWRDRKQPGQPEDPLYHHGAIAEELVEIFPEFVPHIPDPTAVDKDGNQLPDAPLIPDSIEYAPAAFTFAVAGYQDLAPRVQALEAQHREDTATIKDLTARITALEGQPA